MSDPFPPNYSQVLNGLIAWGRSGLIPNTKIVKSYHSPVIDPVTGIPVLMPATVYVSGVTTRSKFDYVLSDYTYRDKPVTYQQSITGGYSNSTTPPSPDISTVSLPVVDPTGIVSVDDLPHFFYAGSSVKDFNVNETPGELDTAVSTYYTAYNSQYREAAANATDQSHYESLTADIRISTVPDRLTRELDYSLPRYVDQLDDAKAMFNEAPREFPAVEGDTKGYAYIPKRYDLVATKIPCAIPGILNCHLVAYDQIDVSQPTVRYQSPNIDVVYLPDSLRSELTWSETFTGDGSTLQLELSNEATNKRCISVMMDNQELLYDTDYTITKPDGSPWTVVFVVAPDDGSSIDIVFDDGKLQKRMLNYDFYDSNPNTDTTAPLTDYTTVVSITR